MRLFGNIFHKSDQDPLIGYRLHLRVKVALAILFTVSLILCVVWMRFIEPGLLAMKYEVVRLPQKKEAEATTTLRVLHLSDFHFSDHVPLSLIESAIERGLDQGPDLVLLTGDFISGKGTEADLKDYGFLLARLPLAAPTFACLGNHDGGTWAAAHGGCASTAVVSELLRRAGIRLLDNAWETVHLGSLQIILIGVGDLWANECLPDRIILPEKITSDAVFSLCHNPDAKDLLRNLPWDVLFCGHSHGGQFVFPLTTWRPFVPVQDRRFAEGLGQWDGRFVYVTRGVGNLHGLRFNCRPEISILDIQIPKDKGWVNSWFPATDTDRKP